MRLAALVGAFVGAASVLAAAAPAHEGRLDACAAAVRDRPAERASWACFWESARDAGERQAALRDVEAQLTVHAGQPWAHYARALLRVRLAEPSAVPDLAAAVERFAAHGDDEWQVWARGLLAGQLTTRGAYADADKQIEAMQAIADRADNADWTIRTLDRRGWNALRQGDYSTARLSFLRAQELLPADAPPDQRIRVASSLGGVAWAMQNDAEALAHYREVLAIDPQNAAARANALALVDQMRLAGRGDPEMSRALALESLDPARGEVTPLLAARAHLILGRLDQGADAHRHLRASLEASRRTGDPAELRSAQRTVGVRLVELGEAYAAEGFRLLEEALSASRREGGLEDRVRSLDMLTAALCLRGLYPAAIARLDELLDTVETIRELQRDEEVKGATLAGYARFYHRHAGYSLSHAELGAEALESAFLIQERMRARLLLDALDAAGATAAVARDAATDPAHDELRASIAAAQRALRAGTPDTASREKQLADLARLELVEREHRARRAMRDERYARLRPAVFPSLDDVRRALGPDEALLSFHVAPAHHFGSWVAVVTRDGARAFRLPAEQEIARDVTLLEGLLWRRDGSESEWARAVGERLLGAALGALPQDVSTLVVVPDSVLWHLPFDVLRTASADVPIGLRYGVQIAPSATVWLRTRQAEDVRSPVAVLSLADPPAASTAGSERRGDGIDSWARLGPLRRARVEARTVVEQFGGASESWIGDQASEARLKAAPLDRFGVLHIAAHAVVDDENPQRTAVVLAPGAADQDGLLQVGEIVRLPLRGKVVVLSACRGAGGMVFRGEGPVGLSRAFLEAGATAVVASLWPLRDADAERAVGEFGERLASGAPLSAALASTRRALHEDGVPAAVWASLVVVGDGSTVVAPGGVPARRAFGYEWIGWACVLIVAAAGVWWVRGVLRTRTPT